MQKTTRAQIQWIFGQISWGSGTNSQSVILEKNTKSPRVGGWTRLEPALSGWVEGAEGASEVGAEPHVGYGQAMWGGRGG